MFIANEPSIECFERQNIYKIFKYYSNGNSYKASYVVEKFHVCRRIQLFECKKNVNRYLFVSCFSILKGFKNYFQFMLL